MSTSRFALPAVLVSMSLLTSCTLRPYDSGVVGCNPGDGAACPTGYACLDPKDQKFSTCVEIGCGDGERDLNAEEQCDDANANVLDLCVDCRVPAYTPVARIGLGPGGADPKRTLLGRPTVVAADEGGNLFIGSIGTNAITRLARGEDNDGDGERDATLTTFAGNGSLVSVDDGEATPPNEVATVFASSIAVDGVGNLFFSDLQNSVVRRIDAVTGDTTTVIGNGIRATGEDNVLGTQTSIDLPVGLAVDGNGTLFLAERASGGQPGRIDRVRRLDRATGRLTTVIERRTAAVVAEGEGEGEAGPNGGGGPIADEVLLGGPPDDIAFDDDGTLYVFSNAFEKNGRRLGNVVDRDIFLGVVILTLDATGAVKTHESLDVLARHETVVLDDDNQELSRTITNETGCTPPERAQERFVVSGDGAFVLWASGQRFIRMTLPTSSSPEPVCTEIGQAPESVEAGSAFNLAPTDVEVVGDTVVFADPGNGVLWELPLRTSGESVEPTIVAGIARAADEEGSAFDVLVDELVLEFAKQTDGHLTASLTTACNPGALAFDSFEFFGSFPELHRVILSDCNSSISVLAGTGIAGFSGDGGPAQTAQLARPSAATRGSDGHIYIADRDNDRIRRLIFTPDDPDAVVVPGEQPVGRFIIDTYIGEGATPGGPVLSPPLFHPAGLAVDDTGSLLIADGHHRVVRVDAVSNVVTGVMGTGAAGFNGDEKAPALTQLDEPTSIVFLPLRLFPGQEALPGGLLIVAERGGHRVRAAVIGAFISPVYTLGGDGTPGDSDSDAAGAGSRFVHPRGLMLSSPSTDLTALGFFVVDAIDRVRTVSLTIDGLDLSATVGTATARLDDRRGAASRDDGDSGTALFRAPSALTFIDEDRAVVVDRLTGRLRLVSTAAGTVRTVTGMPDGLVVDSAAVPAFIAAPLGTPVGIAFDDSVEPPVLYVSEAQPAGLRRFVLVDPAVPETWTTSRVTVRGSDDDASSPFIRPAGLGIDVVGRVLYLADQGAHTVVAINLDDTPVATVVAGIAGRRGDAGDGGLATSALLNEPEGVVVVAVDGVSSVIVADTGNNRVRRVDLDKDVGTGVISAVLGNGAFSSGGDGAPAQAFPVQAPRGLAVDAVGNLIVTSENALRFVQAGDKGIVAGTDDVRTIYGGVERESFPEPVTRCLSAVALPPSSSTTQAPVLYAVDACLGLLVRLQR